MWRVPRRDSWKSRKPRFFKAGRMMSPNFFKISTNIFPHACNQVKSKNLHSQHGSNLIGTLFNIENWDIFISVEIPVTTEPKTPFFK
jgi:hypothetical protein